MLIDREDIEDALYNSVCDNIGGGGGKAVPGPRAIDNFRARIKRFLSCLPGEMTISEVRKEMEI